MTNQLVGPNTDSANYFHLSETDLRLLVQLPSGSRTIKDVIDYLNALEDEILYDDHPVPVDQVADGIHLAALMLRLLDGEG